MASTMGGLQRATTCRGVEAGGAGGLQAGQPWERARAWWPDCTRARTGDEGGADRQRESQASEPPRSAESHRQRPSPPAPPTCSPERKSLH